MDHSDYAVPYNVIGVERHSFLSQIHGAPRVPVQVLCPAKVHDIQICPSMPGVGFGVFGIEPRRSLEELTCLTIGGPRAA